MNLKIKVYSELSEKIENEEYLAIKNNNVIKNSANSNKNLSEISEQINTNLSTSKFEPFQEIVYNNINKVNGESSSDKNCGLIQSLSNNIETDHFLHKKISCKTIQVYLGEIIYNGFTNPKYIKAMMFIEMFILNTYRCFY